jgi:hypothetical protein
MAIVDAVSNDDLLRLGPALKGMPLVTGGSGVAIGLPANFGLAPSSCRPASCRPPHRAAGRRVGQLLAGHQPAGAALHRQRPPGAGDRPAAHRVGRGRGGRSAGLGRATAGRRARCWSIPPPSPAAVKTVQGKLGVEESRRDGGAYAGRDCSRPGRRGVRQLVRGRRRNLGGLRAGAGHHANEASARRSTPACRGAMPWPHCQTGLHITLKSGNFGTDDFFTKAFIAGMTSTPAFMDEAQARDEICRVGQAACSSGATCTPRQATSACGWPMAT